MPPENALPLPECFSNTEEYVEALLQFVSSCELMQLLTGGVHILDFFARTPDLYAWLLNEEWRDWFNLHDLQDILDFVLREDLEQFSISQTSAISWRNKPLPPRSLVRYVHDVRRLSLNRNFYPQQKKGLNGSPKEQDTLPRHLAVGMKVKKIHEVDHFSRYIQQLTEDVTATKQREVTHLVDFGSGQNYLGRTLASQPYNQHVIAVESKQHNIEGAKTLDIFAKIAPRAGILRNKKEYRAQQDSIKASSRTSERQDDRDDASALPPGKVIGDDSVLMRNGNAFKAKLDSRPESNGTVQYVEHRLEDWDLSAVIEEIIDDSESPDHETDSEVNGSFDPSLMVMSIHSCGNLSHHGIRSILNPSVKAVAIVGCCYNLVTERLTPPTYKHPNLRPGSNPWANPLLRAPVTGDPHGFPMSSRVATYPTPIHFNITARMMAVQAPANWGLADSDAFFTRHFYRALLQKIFVDRGVVDPPSDTEDSEQSYANYVVGGKTNVSGTVCGSTQPIIIGSLGKGCYDSFLRYIRGALAKLVKDPDRGPLFVENMGSMTDKEILHYESEYAKRKKDLCVVWTLMAFSAVLVEAVIVIDRWLWLKEQEQVEDAWVEAVFDYKKSPRNLVVVGIKK